MNNIPITEDDDELELLRIAALQSLKKKNDSAENSQIYYQSNVDNSPHYKSKGNRGKWRKFNNQQRGGKSFQVQFNSRIRSTNLISITPVGAEADADENLSAVAEGKLKTDQTSVEQMADDGSKFTRYNKSDKSDSESEGEINTAVQPEKVHKSNSLEALMQELDEEIQGKVEGEGIPTENSTSMTEPSASVENIPPIEVGLIGNISENKTLNPNQIGNSPTKRRNFFRKNNKFFHKKHRHFPPMQPHIPIFNPPHNFGPPLVQYMNPPMGPLLIPQNPNPIMPPMYYDRPLSPLSINTESLATAAMAPLSPRSAAFVLENKAIIERRRRSPRRSYSRSLSRSRSRSPRRYSVSPPRRFRRSHSPRKLSPIRSPRRLSPLRKRSLSPRRRSVSPKRMSPNQVKTVYNRLGNKSNSTKDNDKSKEKDKETKEVPMQNTAPLDPILEARRKKFETNEIKKKEGIIRLKPKEDVPTEGIEKSRVEGDTSKAEDDKSKAEVVKPKLDLAKPKTDINISKELIKPKPRTILNKPKVDIKNKIDTNKNKTDNNISNKVGKSKAELTIIPADKIKKEKIDDSYEMKNMSTNTKKTSASTERTTANTKKTAISANKTTAISEKSTASSEKTNASSEKTTANKDKTEVGTEKKIARSSSTNKTSVTNDKSKDPIEFQELEKLLGLDDSALDDIELDSKVDDIFSDEESDDENEGRFKTEEKQTAKVPVIPFSKLTNNKKPEKPKPISFSSSKPAPTEKVRPSTLAPTSITTKYSSREKAPSTSFEPQNKKKRIVMNPERNTLEKKTENKIQINIRNPSKYERKDTVRSKVKSLVGSSKADISEYEDDDDVVIQEDIRIPETISDSSDEDVILTGDLRTQLSKKRAEKLHKIPAEEVSSRLLKYALQGALKKAKKKSKRKTLTFSDGKLPIHLRLGINPAEIFEEVRIKKKSKKRKLRELLEQV